MKGGEGGGGAIYTNTVISQNAEIRMRDNTNTMLAVILPPCGAAQQSAG